MAMTDHPAWEEYKAALTRLARAGVRMEAARAMDAPELHEVEQSFQEAMEAYDAVRERLAAPAPVSFDGAPVARAWLGPAELAFRASVAGREGREAEQG